MNRPPIQGPTLFLRPAEICVSDRPLLVTTVLGSCVSLTLFSPSKGVGAICHAMLARCPMRDKDCREHCQDPYKYVDCVVPELIRRMNEYGVMQKEMQAKLFGGADMLSRGAPPNGRRSVGRQNVDAVLAVARELGLHIMAHDVGGCRGRRIFFHTGTGEVWLRKVQESDPKVCFA